MTTHVEEKDALAPQPNGYPGGILIGHPHGAVKGFCMGIAYYDQTHYLTPGIHEDQEGFYVLEGTGMAKVGNEEFAVRPGVSFLAAQGVPHAIKRDRDSAPVKVLWAHGAV